MSQSVELIRLEETTSTNRYIRTLMQERTNAESLVVLSNYQSDGQGQAGNHWESERGANLLFSMLVYPQQLYADSFFILSQIVSLSIQSTLHHYTDHITIKWPNDIYWNDRKICGILIENDIAGSQILQSIIGVGINLNQEQFLSDAPNPISLKQITGDETDPMDVLSRFLLNYENLYARFLNGEKMDLMTEYRAVMYRGTGFYPYEDAAGCFEGRVVDVEPYGFLVLEDRDGQIRKYAFKEVSFL